MSIVKEETKSKENLKELLAEKAYTQISKLGDTVKGKIIDTSKSEVHIDIDGLTTGVVRGRELYKESAEYSKLKPGDEIEATVIELENEKGELELSFRFAGHKKTWSNLTDLQKKGEIISAKVIDANKGGLMVKFESTIGFLPVSQLNPEHYPRVQGGDKNKILERLKSYVGQEFRCKIIDANEKEEKLIISEKAAWEEEQGGVISKYKIGDIIEGKATAVTDFGVFINFGENLEGLIHISELAWQRIDDPRNFVKVGEEIKAEIINIEGSKIFLSIKKLKGDPWKDINKKYKIGQKVKGKVIKANPFGLFVELDKDIHGLAHISELSVKPISSPEEIAKPGDTLELKIVSIEPKEHRLGLSIKALEESSYAKASEDKSTSASPDTKSSDDKTADKKAAAKKEKEEKKDTGDKEAKKPEKEEAKEEDKKETKEKAKEEDKPEETEEKK